MTPGFIDLKFLLAVLAAGVVAGVLYYEYTRRVVRQWLKKV